MSFVNGAIVFLFKDLLKTSIPYNGTNSDCL